MTARLSFSRTRLQYGTKRFLLDLIICCEIAVCVGLTLLCAAFGSRAYSSPSFIEISMDGTAYYIPDSRKVLTDWVPTDLTMERFIKSFFRNFRSVSSDVEENYDALGRALYRSSGQAYNVILAYLNANPPSSRMKKETVDIPYEDIVLTKYTDNIWRVVWREVVTDLNGVVRSDKQYEAVVYTGHAWPSDDTARTWNPLGLYITYLDSDLLQSYM